MLLALCRASPSLSCLSKIHDRALAQLDEGETAFGQVQETGARP